MPAPANRPGYDKAGSVLRVETTINDAARFKSYRSPEGKPNAAKAWHPMAKGIGELHRRAEVSRASNTRYLPALASVENTTSLGPLSARVGKPAKYRDRRVRPLNPYAPQDAELLTSISRGEFTINGFPNRDLRKILFDDATDLPDAQRRHAAVVSRQLALLRGHRLIKKVTGTHRYNPTAQGPHHRRCPDRRSKFQHRGTCKAGSVRNSSQIEGILGLD